ncbi:MAG: HIT family protein [Nitriliruptoraceae bacterium]
MTSVFTRIIDGELSGRFVWSDDVAVAFLTINPVTPGHTLVVPRAEVDHWLDLDADVWEHCSRVVRHVGAAIQEAFDPPRVGQLVAGFEVAHVHVHVLAVASMADLDLSRAESDPDPQVMDDAAARIRTALRRQGHDAHVSGD